MAVRASPGKLTSLARAPSTLSRVDAVPAPRFQERFGRRVFAYIALLAGLSSVASTAMFYWRQRDFTNAELQRRAQTLVRGLAAEAELGVYAHDAGLCLQPLRHAAGEDDVVYAALYDRQGHEILHLPPGLPPPPPTREVFARLDGPSARLPTTFGGEAVAGEPILERYAPVLTGTRDAALTIALGPGGAPPPVEAVGLARIGLSRQFATERLREVLGRGLLLGAIVLVLGLFAAVVISNRLSRPVRALIRGAERLRAGDLEARVEIGSKDELGQLAHAFNRMARRLNESIAALEDLNRDLEDEVARRTAEVQRAADFAALLQAPLGPSTVLPDYEPAAALVGGPATGGLATLLDQALEAFVAAMGGSAAAAWLVPETPTPGDEPAPLLLARYQGAFPGAFEPTPPAEFLDANVPYVEPAANGHRVVAPLLLGTEVLGAVMLLGAELREDQMSFMAHASAQLAVAVGNVRAYAAADRLAHALTERNSALARQRDQLQQVNRLKTEFLANVSHELRTPLNAIIGYGELLADGVYGPVNDLQRTALLGIDDSGKNLLALINQILDLAKVEAGKMSIFVEDVDLELLTRAVVHEASGLARDRPYRIGLAVEGRVHLRTDGAKVKQILTNLVSNAVKFTPDGHVDLTVRAEPDGGCTIAVADSGIGIEPEDMKIIFEEFRQVDGSYTREFGGTGLGLAIASRLAALLGGAIEVESTVGVGSTFTLRLPADLPPSAPRVSGALPAHVEPASPAVRGAYAP